MLKTEGEYLRIGNSTASVVMEMSLDVAGLREGRLAEVFLKDILSQLTNYAP